MKAYIQNINEITDSREILEARPNSFIAIFVYILISILVAALIWSYFGEIDAYVKASGVVRPNDKISTIKNIVAGKVEKITYEDGQKVKKGDLLYSIEHTNLDLEKATTENQLKKVKQDIANLRKFKSSITDGENQFNKNSESEADYYNRFAKYENDIQVNLEQAKNANLDLQQLKMEATLSAKSYQESIAKNKETTNNLVLLKQSIEQNNNLMDSSNIEYSNKFQDYSYNLTKLSGVVQQKKDAYKMAESLFKVGGISRKDLNDTKDSLASAELELDKFKNGYFMELSSNIQKYTTDTVQLELNLERSQQSIATASGKSDKTELIINKYKLETLTQISDTIISQEQNAEKLEKDLKTIELNLTNSMATAPMDGTVNVITDMNEGDVLQSGSEVATIVPQTNSEYKVQLYVTNKDIASIKLGQPIKYHFLALPYQEYGDLTGYVTRIGTDAKIDQQSGSSYYIVEAALDNKPLYSYKGVKSEVKVGMACEAQVINNSKKILYWFLEKINLRD